MRTDYGLPLVVCSKLVWCDERQSYQCTWQQVPAKWLRQRSEAGPQPWWMEWNDMKRYMQEVSKTDKKWVTPKEPMLAKRKHLAQLLTDPWWEDGSARDVCYLTVRVGLDSVQISINDVENKASATTTGSTIEEVLDLMEECFAAGKNPWRKWGAAQKKK